MEHPVGQGFGAALLKLAPLYRANETHQGRTVTLHESWPDPDTQPAIAKPLTPEQTALLFREDVNGTATLSCGVTAEGAVEGCVTLEESAAGVGAAAMVLARQLSMRPATFRGRPIASGVTIPITIQPPPQLRQVRARCVVGRDGRFGSCTVTELAGFSPSVSDRLGQMFTRTSCKPMGEPGATVERTMHLPPDAFERPEGSRIVIAPDWAEQPTMDVLRRYYPASREARRSGGRATVSCEVSKAGAATNCEVASETPPGLGFGQAAVAMAGELKFQPLLVDCEPTDGGRIRLPFVFPPY